MKIRIFGKVLRDFDASTITSKKLAETVGVSKRAIAIQGNKKNWAFIPGINRSKNWIISGLPDAYQAAVYTHVGYLAAKLDVYHRKALETVKRKAAKRPLRFDKFLELYIAALYDLEVNELNMEAINESQTIVL
jgi:hypothetical protein